MNVTEQTSNLPSKAHPSDFDFLRTLIREIDNIPTKEKVHFPLPSRTSAFAEPDCELGYDDYGIPYAHFFFRLRRHGLEMAHSVIVGYTVEEGQLYYLMQVWPNSRLRRNGHKRSCSTHKDAKALALAICRTYAMGSVHRKVIPLVEKETA